MSTKKSSVGAEVVALCIQCKEPKIHAVTGLIRERIARVRCKVCESSHPFVERKPAERKPRRRTEKVSPEQVWEKMLTLASSQKRIPYTFSGTFKENDLIDHNTFGVGVVTHLLAGNKIQVMFKDGKRILVAGR